MLPISKGGTAVTARLLRATGVLVAIAWLSGPFLCGQPADSGFDTVLRWRMIGPFRGGRTVAVAGVPKRPNVFYMAANNGGVWRTDDYGRTWDPIFDDQTVSSVGRSEKLRLMSVRTESHVLHTRRSAFSRIYAR